MKEEKQRNGIKKKRITSFILGGIVAGSIILTKACFPRTWLFISFALIIIALCLAIWQAASRIKGR